MRIAPERSFVLICAQLMSGLQLGELIGSPRVLGVCEGLPLLPGAKVKQGLDNPRP